MWPMKTYFVGYLAALAALAILDALWLGLVESRFLQGPPGPAPARAAELVRRDSVLSDPRRWASSCSPCLSPASWVSAVLYGALFGFCVYAAYDLTNLATLRGWPLTVSLVDLAWGAVVTAAAAAAAFLAMRSA